MGKEQPPHYYDSVYAKSETYANHYRASHYFPMWNKVTEGLDTTAPVIDIGCGVGQFGHYLHDLGVTKYLGLDFSRIAIDKAKQRVKETDTFGFRKTDIFQFDFAPYKGCQIFCLETLEHIEHDLKFIDRLKEQMPFSPITITVPTFNDPAHVRFFRSVSEVTERYSAIENKTVIPFSKWFILTGTL